MNILDYGFHPTMVPEGSDGIPARITAVHRERYEIVCEYGETFGRLKSSIYSNNRNGLLQTAELIPTTGDFVLIQYNPTGDSLIIKTLDRKSKFARSDYSGHAAGYVKTIHEQVVAANFDVVFIMQSLNHDLNVNRLERYLTLTWQSGAIPVILLTKADLVSDPADKLNEIAQVAAGVDIFVVSAKTGFGLDALFAYLQPGKTIVFMGSSGVGKSSLVNALVGEERMEVTEVRESDSKGRHKTTHRQLILLKNGVMVIDTPGMRELGMWDVSTGLGEAFSDVEQYLGRCKFSDCKHQVEPGCAIQSAIRNNTLSLERWEHYQQIKQEARFVGKKSAQPRKNDRSTKLKQKERKEKPDEYSNR